MIFIMIVYIYLPFDYLTFSEQIIDKYVFSDSAWKSDFREL